MNALAEKDFKEYISLEPEGKKAEKLMEIAVMDAVKSADTAKCPSCGKDVKIASPECPGCGSDFKKFLNG